MQHPQILSIPEQLTPLLQAARKSAGLSQTELARRLDLSQSRMSAIELCPASMRLDQFLALCATLGLELSIQQQRPTHLLDEQASASPLTLRTGVEPPPSEW